MVTLGRHLIAELYGCDARALDDVERLRAGAVEAAEAIGATVLGVTFHEFAPQGVSGTVVIAESHISLHTWPEHGYGAVDIYTCGGLDPRPAIELLGRVLGASALRVQEIRRGLPEDLCPGHPLAPDDVQIEDHTAPVVRLMT